MRGLVVKDILRDAYEPDLAPRRRIGPHTLGVQLLAFARGRPHSWANAVAHAKYKAALLRGEEDISGFQSDPFKWNVCGWLSHAQVTFQWKWYDPKHGWKTELAHECVLHLIIHNRAVPLPMSLRHRPEDRRQKLEEAASKHVLCNYLGEKQGLDSFEPDPSKWIVCGKETVVWFEWLHVTKRGKPHRVPMRVDDVLAPSEDYGRKVAGNPLSKSAPSLTFSVEYLAKLAAHKCPGAEYAGFAFESERPEIQLDLPNEGKDIQNLPLTWTLPPDGRAIQASLIDFNAVEEFEPPEYGSDEAYEAIGREMHWDVLGVPEHEADMVELRNDPGELQDKRWLQIAWKKPAKETDKCFWLVNATEPDKAKPPSLACRSLACLRLELERNKTASSVKLRTAYDNRSNDNSIAADVLRKSRLWQRLGGPSPDALFSPSRSSLDRCAACLSALEELEAKDGVDEAFANEVRKAVGLLKSLAWDDIRIERFPLTPPGLYTELVRNAECSAGPDMFFVACLRSGVFGRSVGRPGAY